MNLNVSMNFVGCSKYKASGIVRDDIDLAGRCLACRAQPHPPYKIIKIDQTTSLALPALYEATLRI